MASSSDHVPVDSVCTTSQSSCNQMLGFLFFKQAKVCLSFASACFAAAAMSGCYGDSLFRSKWRHNSGEFTEPGERETIHLFINSLMFFDIRFRRLFSLSVALHHTLNSGESSICFRTSSPEPNARRTSIDMRHHDSVNEKLSLVHTVCSLCKRGFHGRCHVDVW
jgi:hypothetical protein